MLTNNKWHDCKKKLPRKGEVVEFELAHSRLRRVGYLDETKVEGVPVWVCEYLGTFNSSRDVARWRPRH